MTTAQHTPGPWRWELNLSHKRLHLVGGRPQYDLTILDFERWGMGNATICLRDTAHNGTNLMHKLHERPDWFAPFEGRAHHKHWCQDVIHPDARLIAAAPELLAHLKIVAFHLRRGDFVNNSSLAGEALDRIENAIAKATGDQP